MKKRLFVPGMRKIPAADLNRAFNEAAKHNRTVNDQVVGAQTTAGAWDDPPEQLLLPEDILHRFRPIVSETVPNTLDIKLGAWTRNGTTVESTEALSLGLGSDVLPYIWATIDDAFIPTTLTLSAQAARPTGAQADLNRSIVWLDFQGGAQLIEFHREQVGNIVDVRRNHVHRWFDVSGVSFVEQAAEPVDAVFGLHVGRFWLSIAAEEPFQVVHNMTQRCIPGVDP